MEELCCVRVFVIFVFALEFVHLDLGDWLNLIFLNKKTPFIYFFKIRLILSEGHLHAQERLDGGLLYFLFSARMEVRSQDLPLPITPLQLEYCLQPQYIKGRPAVDV